MAFSGDQPEFKQIDLSVETSGTVGASGSILFHSTSGLIQHIGGVWATLTGTAGALDSLTDVSDAGHADGEALVSNGSTFVFEPLTLSDHVSGALTDLSNVATAGHTNGQALTSNGTTFIMESLTLADQVAGDLTDLGNVVTAGHTNGQALTSNGTTFIMESLTLADQVAGAINDLSDVSTAGVATDEVLIYNGSSYVFDGLVAGDNITVAVSGISNVDTTTNSPESTAGLSMISDGDTTYSFSEIVTARTTVSTVTAPTSAVVNNLYLCDSAASGYTVTLPATHAAGDRIIMKCTGDSQTNNITIATADADTIDGAATQTLASNFGAIEAVSNGTNWFLI